jgi:hypothetical protein
MPGYSASGSASMAQVWRVHRKGPPPLTLQKDTVAIPEPKRGEVLVKVHSAAVNPGESGPAIPPSGRKNEQGTHAS